MYFVYILENAICNFFNVSVILAKYRILRDEKAKSTENEILKISPEQK